jgi:hypothetical protein
MKTLLLLVLCAGCLPKTITSEGPEIRVKVDQVAGFGFTSDSSTKNLDLEASGNYDFTLVVEAHSGKTVTVGKEASEGSRYADVTELDATITPPGTALTAADFMVDDQFAATHERDFVGTQTFSIPGAMAGQMAMFHVVATDTLGLESNLVDFAAMLRP